MIWNKDLESNRTFLCETLNRTNLTRRFLKRRRLCFTREYVVWDGSGERERERERYRISLCADRETFKLHGKRRVSRYMSDTLWCGRDSWMAPVFWFLYSTSSFFDCTGCPENNESNEIIHSCSHPEFFVGISFDKLIQTIKNFT